MACGARLRRSHPSGAQPQPPAGARQRPARARPAVLATAIALAALCLLPAPALAKQRERDLIGWSEDFKGGSSGGSRRGSQAAARRQDPGRRQDLEEEEQPQLEQEEDWTDAFGMNPDERKDFFGSGYDTVEDMAPTERPRGMKVLSWEPRIFLFERLLTDEECDHMIKQANPRLERSGVVDTDSGGEAISKVRTSRGMFFDRGEDEVIEGVERKLSEWTLVPVGQGEGIQVLQYEKGQEYKPHHDYFFHEGGTDNGGNRLATILMYLTDVEAGGETVFPNAKRPASQTRAAGFSECAMQGLAVRPRKGDAVLFWSLRTDGRLDPGALHGSCPVIRGLKYSATKWFHVAHYAMGGERAVKVQHVVHVPPPPPAPPGCRDKKDACKGWAEGGECEHNAGYMVGTREHPGDCLLSCGRCDLASNKS